VRSHPATAVVTSHRPLASRLVSTCIGSRSSAASGDQAMTSRRSTAIVSACPVNEPADRVGAQPDDRKFAGDPPRGGDLG